MGLGVSVEDGESMARMDVHYITGARLQRLFYPAQ